MSELTVSDLDKLCQEARDIDLECDEIKAALKLKTEALSELKAKILAIFDQHDKTKYLANCGTFYVVNRWAYATPKGEDFLKYRDWYIARHGEDAWWGHCSVNSQTLNAYLNEETAAELEKGNVDFRPAGVAEAKLVRNIQIRKA